jgi:glutathione peroxidase-family protein
VSGASLVICVNDGNDHSWNFSKFVIEKRNIVKLYCQKKSGT